MDRRKFVRRSCSLCMAASSGMLIGSLASCGTALPIFKTEAIKNKISVPVNLFAKSDFQLVQPKGMFYNIGLKKEKDGSYTALLLRCTHADNQLIAMGSNGFKCTLHGSTFNDEGRVTNGPAEIPLEKFGTQVIADHIIIQLR